jgi:hypothetical protein
VAAKGRHLESPAIRITHHPEVGLSQADSGDLSGYPHPLSEWPTTRNQVNAKLLTLR